MRRTVLAALFKNTMKYVVILALFMGLGLIEESFKKFKVSAPSKFILTLAAAFVYQFAVLVVVTLAVEEASFDGEEGLGALLICMGLAISVGTAAFTIWPQLRGHDGAIHYPEGTISAKDRVKAWYEKDQ